jgi:hypothetical protein
MKDLINIIIQEKLKINSKSNISNIDYTDWKEGDIIYFYGINRIEFYEIKKVLSNKEFELIELGFNIISGSLKSKNYIIEPNKSQKRKTPITAHINSDKQLEIKFNDWLTSKSNAYLYEDEPIKYKE